MMCGTLEIPRTAQRHMTALPTDFTPDAPTGTTRWKNRIVGTENWPPDQLMANPLNFRVHPKGQQDALESVLDRVGFVTGVIVNQRTGTIVDGHLRVSLALRRNEATIPVTLVDLSEEEERLVLATIDPLSAMAGTDDAKMRELFAMVAADAKDDEVMQSLLADIAEMEHVDLGAAAGEATPPASDGETWSVKLSARQVEIVRNAINAAKGRGPLTQVSLNDADALVRIAEHFLSD